MHVWHLGGENQSVGWVFHLAVRICQSPAINPPLQMTHYPLPITNYQLPIKPLPFLELHLASCSKHQLKFAIVVPF